MKSTILLTALLFSAAANAQIPANTMFVTENQNGGTLAMYHDSRCFSTIGMYSESPMQGVTMRGCVLNASADVMDVAWDSGQHSYLDYTGWTKVGK